MESHHYHTDYAKLLLNEQKQKNLDELKNKSLAKSQEPETFTMTTEFDDHPEQKHPEDKHSKNKIDRPERGIETMFRVSSSNHQRLSDMADNKAHIMITVNSIILSAVISLLLRKLDENSYLMIPTFMLLAASLITIIFSILATRPTIPNGLFYKKGYRREESQSFVFWEFLPDEPAGLQGRNGKDDG